MNETNVGTDIEEKKKHIGKEGKHKFSIRHKKIKLYHKSKSQEKRKKKVKQFKNYNSLKYKKKYEKPKKKKKKTSMLLNKKNNANLEKKASHSNVVISEKTQSFINHDKSINENVSKKNFTNKNLNEKEPIPPDNSSTKYISNNKCNETHMSNNLDANKELPTGVKKDQNGSSNYIYEKITCKRILQNYVEKTNVKENKDICKSIEDNNTNHSLLKNQEIKSIKICNKEQNIKRNIFKTQNWKNGFNPSIRNNYGSRYVGISERGGLKIKNSRIIRNGTKNVFISKCCTVKKNKTFSIESNTKLKKEKSSDESKSEIYKNIHHTIINDIDEINNKITRKVAIDKTKNVKDIDMDKKNMNENLKYFNTLPENVSLVEDNASIKETFESTSKDTTFIELEKVHLTNFKELPIPLKNDTDQIKFILENLSEEKIISLSIPFDENSKIVKYLNLLSIEKIEKIIKLLDVDNYKSFIFIFKEDKIVKIIENISINTSISILLNLPQNKLTYIFDKMTEQIIIKIINTISLCKFYYIIECLPIEKISPLSNHISYDKLYILHNSLTCKNLSLITNDLYISTTNRLMNDLPLHKSIKIMKYLSIKKMALCININYMSVYFAAEICKSFNSPEIVDILFYLNEKNTEILLKECDIKKIVVYINYIPVNKFKTIIHKFPTSFLKQIINDISMKYIIQIFISLPQNKTIECLYSLSPKKLNILITTIPTKNLIIDLIIRNGKPTTSVESSIKDHKIYKKNKRKQKKLIKMLDYSNIFLILNELSGKNYDTFCKLLCANQIKDIISNHTIDCEQAVKIIIYLPINKIIEILGNLEKDKFTAIIKHFPYVIREIINQRIYNENHALQENSEFTNSNNVDENLYNNNNNFKDNAENGSNKIKRIHQIFITFKLLKFIKFFNDYYNLKEIKKYAYSNYIQERKKNDIIHSINIKNYLKFLNCTPCIKIMRIENAINKALNKNVYNKNNVIDSIFIFFNIYHKTKIQKYINEQKVICSLENSTLIKKEKEKKRKCIEGSSILSSNINTSQDHNQYEKNEYINENNINENMLHNVNKYSLKNEQKSNDETKNISDNIKPIEDSKQSSILKIKNNYYVFIIYLVSFIKKHIQKCIILSTQISSENCSKNQIIKYCNIVNAEENLSDESKNKDVKDNQNNIICVNNENKNEIDQTNIRKEYKFSKIFFNSVRKIMKSIFYTVKKINKMDNSLFVTKNNSASNIIRTKIIYCKNVVKNMIFNELNIKESFRNYLTFENNKRENIADKCILEESRRVHTNEITNSLNYLDYSIVKNLTENINFIGDDELGQMCKENDNLKNKYIVKDLNENKESKEIKQIVKKMENIEYKHNDETFYDFPNNNILLLNKSKIPQLSSSNENVIITDNIFDNNCGIEIQTHNKLINTEKNNGNRNNIHSIEGSYKNNAKDVVKDSIKNRTVETLDVFEKERNFNISSKQSNKIYLKNIKKEYSINRNHYSLFPNLKFFKNKITPKKQNTVTINNDNSNLEQRKENLSNNDNITNLSPNVGIIKDKKQCCLRFMFVLNDINLENNMNNTTIVINFYFQKTNKYFKKYKNNILGASLVINTNINGKNNVININTPNNDNYCYISSNIISLNKYNINNDPFENYWKNINLQNSNDNNKNNLNDCNSDISDLDKQMFENSFLVTIDNSAKKPKYENIIEYVPFNCEHTNFIDQLLQDYINLNIKKTTNIKQSMKKVYKNFYSNFILLWTCKNIGYIYLDKNNSLYININDSTNNFSINLHKKIYNVISDIKSSKKNDFIFVKSYKDKIIFQKIKTLFSKVFLKKNDTSNDILNKSTIDQDIQNDEITENKFVCLSNEHNTSKVNKNNIENNEVINCLNCINKTNIQINNTHDDQNSEQNKLNIIQNNIGDSQSEICFGDDCYNTYKKYNPSYNCCSQNNVTYNDKNFETSEIYKNIIMTCKNLDLPYKDNVSEQFEIKKETMLNENNNIKGKQQCYNETGYNISKKIKNTSWNAKMDKNDFYNNTYSKSLSTNKQNIVTNRFNNIIYKANKKLTFKEKIIDDKLLKTYNINRESLNSLTESEKQIVDEIKNDEFNKIIEQELYNESNIYKFQDSFPLRSIGYTEEEFNIIMYLEKRKKRQNSKKKTIKKNINCLISSLNNIKMRKLNFIPLLENSLCNYNINTYFSHLETDYNYDKNENKGSDIIDQNLFIEDIKKKHRTLSNEHNNIEDSQSSNNLNVQNGNSLFLTFGNNKKKHIYKENPNNNCKNNNPPKLMCKHILTNEFDKNTKISDVNNVSGESDDMRQIHETNKMHKNKKNIRASLKNIPNIYIHEKPQNKKENFLNPLHQSNKRICYSESSSRKLTHKKSDIYNKIINESNRTRSSDFIRQTEENNLTTNFQKKGYNKRLINKANKTNQANINLFKKTISNNAHDRNNSNTILNSNKITHENYGSNYRTRQEKSVGESKLIPMKDTLEYPNETIPSVESKNAYINDSKQREQNKKCENEETGLLNMYCLFENKSDFFYLISEGYSKASSFVDDNMLIHSKLYNDIFDIKKNDMLIWYNQSICNDCKKLDGDNNSNNINNPNDNISNENNLCIHRNPKILCNICGEVFKKSLLNDLFFFKIIIINKKNIFLKRLIIDIHYESPLINAHFTSKDNIKYILEKSTKQYKLKIIAITKKKVHKKLSLSKSKFLRKCLEIELISNFQNTNNLISTQNYNNHISTTDPYYCINVSRTPSIHNMDEYKQNIIDEQIETHSEDLPNDLSNDLPNAVQSPQFNFDTFNSSIAILTFSILDDKNKK
ncbi:chloroquine resistance marker protein [Plasmodium yoelii yoelii]|nr:chloroquine resistance marker protein [Plasmodium yoelii yoelii]